MGSVEEKKEYDVILAGGGTAACIIAGRLAEADPSLSILVVEQGPNNLNDSTIVTPAVYLSHLQPTSKKTIFYKSNKEEALNGREAVVPAGGVLGGGSSINFMMYTRAQRCDYDSWNTKGWDAKSLLPFAKKLERYHYDSPGVNKELHGYDGPINVSSGTHVANTAQDDIIEAAKATGEQEVDDLQDFEASNGFSRWLRYICPRGARQDTAHRYVHPLMASGNYPHLHLLVESTVTCVIFDGNRATGVEYRATTPATGEQGKTYTVKAKKLVVVSAGALGTPQILERSGVGSAAILDKLGIPVVSDLPGVGEEYQDHNLIGYPYMTTLAPDQTLDGLNSGRLDFAKALEEKNPILGWNGIDVAAKIRPTEAEVAELGPDFQQLWDRDFKKQTDRPLMLMAAVNYSFDPETTSDAGGGPRQCINMCCYTAYPYSRGNIHITSKDPAAPPSFNTGFLSHPADLKKLLWAYKKQREIFRRTNCYDGEMAVGHPQFREGSKAALSDKKPADGLFTSLEDRRRLPPIEYDAEDDAAIEHWIRGHMNTTWHSLGTCKMAPREHKGVVDENLNVYGTEGLKLADLSICPENVGANTNNTALIVGEKAAWIIGRELGLSISP
ncbi:Alcohol oxidase [Metarhizium anisopliae BRIP 53293]|uniref:Alcohol oxidase n=1 Tax=Metarhizium anisopliae BRIP 53293 TaxID=1291518 RepID=A0A0D9NQJ2_METAN|nr:Alcohol oxidase [Metarhizium anisopliae BRIP 53293]KJK96060.1 Alcohol oxidase [Metarhizium anisopliae BRIP 53284]